MPKNLGVGTFQDPVGHFGALWRPLWILQAVRRCRRWASALFAARLVFFLVSFFSSIFLKLTNHLYFNSIFPKKILINFFRFDFFQKFTNWLLFFSLFFLKDQLTIFFLFDFFLKTLSYWVLVNDFRYIAQAYKVGPPTLHQPRTAPTYTVVSFDPFRLGDGGGVSYRILGEYPVDPIQRRPLVPKIV